MDDEEIIKQIKDIEQKEGLPAGYIAELLYQKSKEGEQVGLMLSRLINHV